MGGDGMEVNVGISEQNRQVIAEGLATFLANTYAVYLKTQNFHWNLTGVEFYPMHILFEKQYEDLAAAVDEIAERIRALGYYVDGTFGGLNKLKTVKDEDKVLSIKDMLHRLVESHETLIRHARKLGEVADAQGDFAAVDMLGRRLGAHEKMVWMLRSSL